MRSGGRGKAGVRGGDRGMGRGGDGDERRGQRKLCVYKRSI